MTATALAAPFYELGEHFAIDLPSARAVFTTRRGGFSKGAYTSLNLGLVTGDEADAVRENRSGLERELGVPLSFVHQVHGREVLELGAEEARERRRAAPDELPRADGQFTREAGLAAAVLTADCLPVAISSGDGVAMLHAGWRGLASGVIPTGVSALRGAGASGELVAAIGPGAGACCYEVGAEVHAAFADHPPEVHRQARLDLPAIARHELEAAGVATVHDISVCTMCNPELLFSHRRDRGVTGRQGGVAWRLC
jgi:YfiH family protein